MDNAKPELSMWRGSVVFSGKLVGQHNSIFLRASTKEKAEKFVKQRIRKYYTQKGMKKEDVVFKVYTTLSCDEEVAFFQAHINDRSYSGLMN